MTLSDKDSLMTVDFAVILLHFPIDVFICQLFDVRVCVWQTTVETMEWNTKMAINDT